MEKGKFLDTSSLNYRKEIKKKKIAGIIFARACCSIGIVIFHYCAHSKGNFKLLQNIANSSIGFMFVTSFFSISGFTLNYNYSSVLSVKKFYYKRWKSIFPPYYICFLYFYSKNVFYTHKLFYRGHWSKLLLTLIGLDGYFLYRTKTYYIVGEWFLGAIIMIYILYPLLSLLIRRNIYMIYFFFIFFYVFIYKVKYFVISDRRNIITCIASFYFGMNASKYRKFSIENKKILIISFLILLILCTVKTSSFILIYQIQGFCLFIILVQIGQYTFKKKMNSLIIGISNLSYSIYLFHHQIIIDMIRVNNPKEWYKHLFLLSITILLTIICAKIHIMVVDSITNNFIYKKFESIFI